MSYIIQKIIHDTQKRRDADAKRFAELDKDECQMCGAYGADKRNLFVSCLYAVHEVVPEAIDLHGVDEIDRSDYYLRICKSCRGRFLSMMADWRDQCLAMRSVPKCHDGEEILGFDDERCVPVRENGAVKMLTPDEWRERERGK